jgi:phage tail-like protein
MAAIGALGVRLDPLMAYNFTINLIDTSSTMALVKSALVSAVADVVLGGFSECSGLEMALEVEEYKEGGRNGAVLKFPTRVTWAPVVLKHGMGALNGLWDWHYDFAVGKGKRKDGIITLLNDLHLPTHIWQFRRGLPVKYTGPSLVAGQSAVAIETLEIVHEGLYQLPLVGLGAAALSFGAATAVTGRI